MGDKGGKKDKNKSQKQMIQRRDQIAKRKQDKQQKSTP
jgi:hypothetical protein